VSLEAAAGRQGVLRCRPSLNLYAHTMLERKTVHILIESRESLNLSDVC